MALCDYFHCAVCDGKAIYDGDDRIRETEDLGVKVLALCSECAKRHTLEVRPLFPDLVVEDNLTGLEPRCNRCRRYGNDVNNPVKHDPEDCPLRHSEGFTRGQHAPAGRGPDPPPEGAVSGSGS